MANEASGLFLRILEEAEDKDLEVIYTFPYEISGITENDWVPETMKNSEPLFNSVVADYRMPQFPTDRHELSYQVAQSTPEAPRLFLMGEEAQPGAEPKVLGLAPSLARIGDYVCQISGFQRAVILRRYLNSLRLVGTGAVAEKELDARISSKVESIAGQRFKGPALMPLFDKNIIMLHISAPTAYRLLG